MVYCHIDVRHVQIIDVSHLILSTVKYQVAFHKIYTEKSRVNCLTISQIELSVKLLLMFWHHKEWIIKFRNLKITIEKLQKSYGQHKLHIFLSTSLKMITSTDNNWYFSSCNECIGLQKDLIASLRNWLYCIT